MPIISRDEDIADLFPPDTVVAIWVSEAAARYLFNVGNTDAQWHGNRVHKWRKDEHTLDYCDRIVIIPHVR